MSGTAGRLFQSRTGTPLAHGNLRKRVLHPLLERLGIPKAGLHAFRHSRVTQLRKAGTPQDLQKQWIGHSSLRTGDRYSHTHEEVEYRRSAAGNVGLDRVLSPKQSQREAPTGQSGLASKTNYLKGKFWLRGRDLNPRPLGYEPNELPDCSTPRHSRKPNGSIAAALRAREGRLDRRTNDAGARATVVQASTVVAEQRRQESQPGGDGENEPHQRSHS